MFDDRRYDWRARRPAGAIATVSASRRTEFFNHNDGARPLLLAGKAHVHCLERVRAVQDFHMNGNGWSDIGYNGLVCPHGRAIEGRGIDAIGAHCPEHNTSGYGFQFMVGGSEIPTEAAYRRMRQLYDDCSARSGRALAKKGHRDGIATACPGDIVYRWVRAGMPAPPVVTVPSPTTPQEIDMQLSDLVTLSVFDATGKATGETEQQTVATLFNRLNWAYTELVRQRADEPNDDAAIERVTALLLDAQNRLDAHVDVDVDELARAIVVQLVGATTPAVTP